MSPPRLSFLLKQCAETRYMIRSDHAVAALFHLRKARADDEAFRYCLFSETAGAEFMTLVGDEGLLQIQYRAREMSYAMNFSGAQENVICLADGKPVGRLLTYSQPGTMTIGGHRPAASLPRTRYRYGCIGELAAGVPGKWITAGTAGETD